MTRAGNRGAPFVAALALLAGITFVTAAWAGVAPASAHPISAALTAAVPKLTGSDGRYTILFLGSDKRCRPIHSSLGAERCSSLESKVAEVGGTGATASSLYPYIWSRAGDAALDLSNNHTGTERTDVMTLLTVNPATGAASALSIPRDMHSFPLDPALASDFCRAGKQRFIDKVNEMYVEAQRCMKTAPNVRAWERSSMAADLVRQNLEYVFNIEIDDWVLATFGAADILGATLDAAAPGLTLVYLDDKSRFASCRTDTLRTGSEMTHKDKYIASNAKYGDLLFLRPGSVDRFGRRSGWSHANCGEPDLPATVRSTSPNFVADSCSATKRSVSGCVFNVPTDLWVGFARARKYDGDTNRIRRAQRILAAITLRVIDAGDGVAKALGGLASMRWYSWPQRNAAGTIKGWNPGPPLVRTSIDLTRIAEIFKVVATARAQLQIGPDAPGGWRAMLMLGQRITLSDGSRCAIGGAGFFAEHRFNSHVACTRAWAARGFGPVTP